MEAMMEKLIYEGKDITRDAEVSIAVYETNAGNTDADSLRLEFATKEGWAYWQPKVGDCVEYRKDNATTGKMYIYDFDIDKTSTTLYASPMPPAASSGVTASKTWESAYLSQIGSEIAGKHGMPFVLYNMEDVPYDIKTQRKGQSDTAFLSDLARREGAALIFYDGKILFADEMKLEEAESVMDLQLNGATYTSTDMDTTKFGSCIVKAGAITGAFTADKNLPTLSIQADGVSSTAEASRMAKGELRNANKNISTITVTTELIEALTAGVAVTLLGDVPAGWEGKLFAYRVRHEWHNNKTAISLRRPLGGY